MAFSIKELEILSGIKAHTIRIWEQRYRFLKPSRTSTNIRTYSNEELKTLLTVALLNKHGIKISRIDRMLPEQRSRAVLQLTRPEAQNEYLVNQLIGCMIDMKSHEFEETLSESVREQGIEETITGLVFLFLEKVGILWQTNRIHPVQEHIVSNIIRQKIISAIDNLPPVAASEPLFILFLPEDEYHELGLLFTYFLLKKKAKPVLYLGASVPLKDVQYILQAKKPSFLYLHLTSFPRTMRFETYLSRLFSSSSAVTILFSGSFTKSYKKALPPNVVFLRSLQQMMTYIDNTAAIR